MRWWSAIALIAACGSDPPPTVRLLVDLRLPKAGLSNEVQSYNVVARGPFTTQCDAFAFAGASEHESAFEGTLAPGVTIEVEGVDVGGGIVHACGASAELDLSGAGEIRVPIYMGNADRVEAIDPNLDRPRARHEIATLADGRVLLVGGSSETTESLLIDMVSGTALPLEGPTSVRNHSVIALPNGDALVLEGLDRDTQIVGRAWRFDSASSSFTELGFQPLLGHTATPLCTRNQCALTGKVLIVGGFDPIGGPSTEAWILDPISGEASSLTYPLGVATHAAIELENGDVLIAGGVDGSGAALSQARIFEPNNSTFRELEPIGGMAELDVARSFFSFALAPTGAAVVFGGLTDTGPTPTIEAFDREQDGFIQPSIIGTPLARNDPIVIPLPDQRILLAGGGQPIQLATAELGNPLVVRLVPADGSHDSTEELAGTLLFDGSVLLSGGAGSAAQSIFRPCPRTPTQCQ